MRRSATAEESRCMRSPGASGRISVPAMARWISRSEGADLSGDRAAIGEKTGGLQRLAMHLIKGRDVVVPFEQRGRAADALDGVRIHLPHGIEDRVIVRVEKVAFVFGMSRDVDLRDAFDW